MTKRAARIRDITQIALCVVLMAICAWITVPSVVPFTLQTFALLFILRYLGGAKGTLVVLAYVLAGVIGIPVFSGFQCGVGAIMGVTGGYILGFIVCALVYWLFEKLLKRTLLAYCVGSLLGLLACYAFGTVWYALVYLRAADSVSVGAVLLVCVVPYLLPDAFKAVLAYFVASKLETRLPSSDLRR